MYLNHTISLCQIWLTSPPEVLQPKRVELKEYVVVTNHDFKPEIGCSRDTLYAPQYPAKPFPESSHSHGLTQLLLVCFAQQPQYPCCVQKLCEEQQAENT